MKKNFPLFSIVIPSYNAKNFLFECLKSVLKNSYKNYEIIVVDNGSTDGTIEFVREKLSPDLKEIKIKHLDKNYGPAKARNEGVDLAGGEYLAFLDSDTKVHHDFIKEALKCFTSDRKIAAIQCKLLLFDKKKYDYAGEYITNLGFLTQVADFSEEDKGQYDKVKEILAAKSAGMFIRKDVFNKVGGFDEDYFIFLEETDLGWRVWIKGFRIVFCPNSIVYHHFSSSKDIFDKNFNNYLIRFHGTKNYITTLMKNLSPFYLFKILPLHILLWTGLGFYLFLRGNFLSSVNIFKGIFWNLRKLPTIFVKRRNIQKDRVFSDKRLFDDLGLMKRESILEYIKKFLKSQRQLVTAENKK